MWFIDAFWQFYESKEEMSAKMVIRPHSFIGYTVYYNYITFGNNNPYKITLLQTSKWNLHVSDLYSILLRDCRMHFHT